MRTIALLARKGGTGKTTLAVHLAVLAAESGRCVLLVDTDPQHSAGDWWRVRKTLPARYGQACRILARGKLNSCLVEFADGYKTLTSRWSVRKIERKAHG